MNRVIEFELNNKIKGNGTSLWGPSKSIYNVHQGQLFEKFSSWELQLFGPKTDWWQYKKLDIVKGSKSAKNPR